MGDRLKTIWLGVEFIAAIGNLAFARRSDDGLALEYVALGCGIGLSYRFVENRYVGRFREQPLRYLAFAALWTVITQALLPNDEESSDLSVAGGVGLGSVLYKLLERS